MSRTLCFTTMGVIWLRQGNCIKAKVRSLLPQSPEIMIAMASSISFRIRLDPIQKYGAAFRMEMPACASCCTEPRAMPMQSALKSSCGQARIIGTGRRIVEKATWRRTAVGNISAWRTTQPWIPSRSTGPGSVETWQNVQIQATLELTEGSACAPDCAGARTKAHAIMIPMPSSTTAPVTFLANRAIRLRGGVDVEPGDGPVRKSCPADLTGDYQVDVADLLVMLGAYASFCP